MITKLEKFINESVRDMMKPKSDEDIKKSLGKLTPDEKLIKSARYEVLWLVKDALEQGANVHTNDDLALRLASNNGHTEVIKLLLDAGADVHAWDDWALRWASEYGHIEVVKLLLDAGANVHALNDYALQNASYNGHIEIVKLLLDAGANVHANKDIALRWASEYGHIEVVKLLKQHMKTNESVRDQMKPKSEEEIKKSLGKLTPNEKLIKGAENGVLWLVKDALKQDADVHAVNDYALRLASYRGHTEVVKLSSRENLGSPGRSSQRMMMLKPEPRLSDGIIG